MVAESARSQPRELGAVEALARLIDVAGSLVDRKRSVVRDADELVRTAGAHVP